MSRMSRKILLLVVTGTVALACSSPSDQNGGVYTYKSKESTRVDSQTQAQPQARTRTEPKSGGGALPRTRSRLGLAPNSRARAESQPTPTPQSLPVVQLQPTPTATPQFQTRPRVTTEPTPSAKAEAQPTPAPRTEATPKAESARKKYVLSSPLPLRTLRSEVLETVVTLPSGTTISYPKNETASQAKYREADGSVQWSSTGFLKNVTVDSVPAASQEAFSAAKIAELNATSTGIYISASVGGWAEGIKGFFAALTRAKPTDDYGKIYEESGKPKFNFTSTVQKRFGDRLNKGVAPTSLSAGDSQKWQKIYAELKRAADRTVETPRSILMVDLGSAKQMQSEWENKRTVPANGAWTIATEVTAVKHGFPNVPCAEFMSELVRQAYQRAGYQVTDDFSDSKGNDLHWGQTAAVENLSKALYKAGWVPWDSSQYRPLTGALLMHGAGYTPGHAYIAAGDDGRLIVDNGAPQGRDLRKEKYRNLAGMYKTGVFFLPPGINPQVW